MASERVALVTGGGSGIGRASAMAFAELGTKVVVVDLDLSGGNETVKQIADNGGEATFIEADVSVASQVEGMIQRAVRTYGSLDYAHNNAGIAGWPDPQKLYHCELEGIR